MGFWAGACAAALLPLLSACDSLWRPFAIDNPMSCVVSASVCPQGERCSSSTGLCEPVSQPLELVAVQPARGPLLGGTPVTLRGQGFVAGSRVHFGDAEAQLVGVADGSTLVVTLPRSTGTPRLVDVTVTSPDGSEAVLTRAFRYYYGTLELSQSATARVAAGAQSLDVGDVNGDGFLDLVAASGTTSGISLMLGRGDGTFGPVQTVSTQRDPVRVVLADLNRDGKPDLVYSDSSQGGVLVRLGVGDGSFQPAVSYSGDRTPRGLAVADVKAS